MLCGGAPPKMPRLPVRDVISTEIGNASQLNSVFSAIAQNLGNLRIAK